MRSKVVWCAALAVVVALTAAACSRSVTGTPSAAGSGDSSQAALPPGSTASGSTAVTVATMHVTLPQGARYTETSADGSLDGCVSAGSAACEARMLDLRAASADPNAQFNAPSTSRPYGWYTGTDVPQCITPSTGPGAGTQATGSTVLEHGFAPIGPKKAEYARWQVTCANGAQDNQVRMWWLPTSKILVVEYASTPALDAQLDQMLAAATFG
ncbi:hypothetical protein LWP59_19320 [Amycolatopsis acidiphila]|uniref:hypothetical protein n=1 Tax=Amycolatopsis acidiphila TaxID=715473 RepID=UPI0019C9145C|nr:hypothetical protein [Amycolatopsis acidiphila]UIJ63626.1 hypothetical protein LWP59_19320 [Amycolatopsis acidiphila]GHG67829.1 hypothetical protein GCM10017788_27020 [Amycolatopsis acidiphila]